MKGGYEENGEGGITRWEMKTNCGLTLLLLLSFLNEISHFTSAFFGT